MSWTIQYLNTIKVVNRNEKCSKRKNGKKHKLEIWFGAGYCKYCNVKLK